MVAPTDDGGFRYPVRSGRPQTTSMPSPGDFVVLTLNPLFSVAHLDAEARREASKLRPGKYVAMVTDLGQGLPLKSKPTNEYYVKFVRDPWQLPPEIDDQVMEGRFKLPAHLAAQLAASIHPHNPRTLLDDEHQAIKPVADFPCAECEFDLSTGSLGVRVTTASRDCTQVLSVPTSELLRLSHMQHEALEVCEMLRQAGEIPPEFNPRPDPQIVSQRFPPSDIRQALEELNGFNSLDAGDVHPDATSCETTPDMNDMLRLLSALLKHPGSKNVPVVDIQYDLSQVETIRDPSYFLRERWELYQIVERATRRMLHSPVEEIAVTEKRKLNRLDSLHCDNFPIPGKEHENTPSQHAPETYAEKARHPASKRRKRQSSETGSTVQIKTLNEDKRANVPITVRSPPPQHHVIAWTGGWRSR